MLSKPATLSIGSEVCLGGSGQSRCPAIARSLWCRASINEDTLTGRRGSTATHELLKQGPRCHGLPEIRRKSMLRMLMIAAAAAFTLSAVVFAGEGGTAEEARAMLDKAVAAVKADKAKALDTFNEGRDGFLDRDLYVFCGRTAS